MVKIIHQHLWLVITAVLSVICLEAPAAVVVSGDSLVLASPTSATTVSLEFGLDLTGADDGGLIEIGNFQFDLLLVGPNAGTDVSVIGAGSTISRLQARTLDVVDTTPTTAFAGTLNFASSFSVPDNGGFVRVDLLVQPGAFGDYTLDILTGTDQSLLTDPIDFFTPVPFATNAGQLSITAVPEPSSVALLVCASMGLAIRVRRKSKLADSIR